MEQLKKLFKDTPYIYIYIYNYIKKNEKYKLKRVR